jgi:preprotein translocase subunit YajC
MCKDGHSNVAWFLVIFPFVLLAVIIGLLMMYQNDEKDKKEEKKDNL